MELLTPRSVHAVDTWRRASWGATIALYLASAASLGVAGAWVVELAGSGPTQPTPELLVAGVATTSAAALAGVASALFLKGAESALARAVARERPACPDGLGVVSPAK
jgi:hypothetical protein